MILTSWQLTGRISFIRKFQKQYELDYNLFPAIANSNANYMFLTAWPKNNMGEIL
jgi:hypothetical protein